MTKVDTNSPAFRRWFGDSKVVDVEGRPLRVYHGSRRSDRIGRRFLRSRATSGPMAFFTDDPNLASSYSTNKQDTSKEAPSDYAEWFLYKARGSRTPVPIDRAWFTLDEGTRRKIASLLPTIGYEDPDQAEGRIVSGSESIMGRDSVYYELRQARGNALRALVEIWLNSGSLFGDEEKFLEVLQAAGLDMARVELDRPDRMDSGVFPVYLSIQRPLVTVDIPADVVETLWRESRRRRAKSAAGGNPDQWDKNTISGRDWMERLDRDIGSGSTHAWTQIPDWVTETLQAFGYDGIRDVGGKGGGIPHTVWIPFRETQVKSAISNRGTFDPEDPIFTNPRRGWLR